MPQTTIPRMTGQEPILAVPDVATAVQYYRDVLGFNEIWQWGEPPVHGGARRDEIGFQFTRNPEVTAATQGQEFYITVQNVAVLAQQHAEQGAEIIEALQNRPWGMREYIVRDLYGYRLRFGESGTTAPPSQELPQEVQVALRLPTWEEMAALNRAVGWAEFTNFETAPRVLENAVFGVTALGNGQAIGCAALMSDHAGFYYIRDVMVHPDWQKRHVGTALMQALMDYLNTNASDHALVGLYTGPNLHNFYAKFGFRGPNNGLYGMTQVVRRK